LTRQEPVRFVGAFDFGIKRYSGFRVVLQGQETDSVDLAFGRDQGVGLYADAYPAVEIEEVMGFPDVGLARDAASKELLKALKGKVAFGAFGRLVALPPKRTQAMVILIAPPWKGRAFEGTKPDNLTSLLDFVETCGDGNERPTIEGKPRAAEAELGDRGKFRFLALAQCDGKGDIRLQGAGQFLKIAACLSQEPGAERTSEGLRDGEARSGLSGGFEGAAIPEEQDIERLQTQANSQIVGWRH
jgi:hypothetical protein